MSFHEDSFHETKRERKFYEDRKIEALRNLSRLIETIKDDIKYNIAQDKMELKYKLERLEYIHKLVRKI